MGFLSKEMSRAHYWRGQSAMLAMDGHSDKKNAPERIWHLPKLTGNSLDHKDHRKNAWETLFEETHVSSTNSVFSQFYYQEEGVWKCQELKNYMVWW